ncbi:MAG: hypothetical protein IFK94_13300 [Acidobacteria bacterium]|uniref:Uncharacterized protein n=1 Tax=Candidatus Polarisedimenticola svalbardensis TaxID=2886004 RepID=A0A8J6Y2I2_9BACT|nr:hypothetical protein [Candidatus Polarisedimenticola svalbardensis]
MTRRFSLAVAVFLVVFGATGLTCAQYETLDNWYFLYLEGGIGTPKSTDQIVGIALDPALGGGIQTSTLIQPDWSSSPVFRIGGGYRWSGGSRITLSYWQFDDEQGVTADGPGLGNLVYTIGPFLDTGAGFNNMGNPGHADFNTGITAQTVDFAWGRQKMMSDYFDVEWSLGLRYAHFEETISGFYDDDVSTGLNFGDVRWGAYKFNESEMIGARAAVRCTYFLTDRIAGTGSIGFSMLEGEVSSVSSFWDADAGGRPAASAAETDDNRSGRIQDLDVGLMLFFMDDMLRIKLGYESSFWDGVPSDLVRNANGSAANLRDRDDLSFSAYTLGVYFEF